MQQQKYVFITGANSGIGLATSKQLADSGYTVIAGVYPSTDAAKKLVNSTKGTVYPVAIDVQESTSIERAFYEISQIVKEEGLTATINCAGIAMLMPCETLTTAEIKAVINNST
jgi:NAD(P)-dependent dehydrogenase (short-subunit alcohol dehydrogenase family)